MSRPLYEIREEIEACIKYGDDYVNTETGEIFDVAAFEKLNLERDVKREQCALLIKNTEAEAEMVKAEIDKLTKRHKALRNVAANVKEYLAYDLNGDAFKTSKVQVGFRKSESVEVLDIKLIPDKYLKMKDPEADKVAIKRVLKAGGIITGCQLVEKQNIQIK